MSDDQAQLQKLIEEAQRLNERLGQSAHGNGGSATISVNAGGWGVAVSCGAVLLALVAVILQGQRISDNQASAMREIERLERRQELHAEWSRQESSILRGYVWTGKVPVANPYPKQEPSK